ncbi:hypothetical protein [Bacillus sp. JJ722]|uniref:hypothetical protein n=1 Tax=Bacillus sp. JJ722 TaxID=3122973 RepID=UPI002FFDACB7
MLKPRINMPSTKLSRGIFNILSIAYAEIVSEASKKWWRALVIGGIYEAKTTIVREGI